MANQYIKSRKFKIAVDIKITIIRQLINKPFIITPSSLLAEHINTDIISKTQDAFCKRYRLLCGCV